jgi:aminopeptidase N
MQTPKTIYRADYRPLDFNITHVNMSFNILDEEVEVITQYKVKKSASAQGNQLYFNGKNFIFQWLKLNNETLNSDQFKINDDSLVFETNLEEFELCIGTKLFPYKNHSLMGLYRSGEILCTQCEAEGFRNITYAFDRPDNLAIYTVDIEADINQYPYLLANGNRKKTEQLSDGRHRVYWEDPFPKPSYLFALVAGNFDCLKDTYQTKSGKTVQLEIYTDPGNLDKSHFAMESLKKSMQWDEDVFDLECDLDHYMIVAVDAFNFGAMENKGLNIFNSKYVLANADAATDRDFYSIESIIGHEYFHNWTGNRVTCRDWFQLTLKEGLTVFRDQEFSADMNSRAVQRIHDVKVLMDKQFPEDAGPFAHAIRPDSFIEINNFYTATVYDKGAEVIRMLQTILGRDDFIMGVKHYLKKFDSQAVTTDDFIQAMFENTDKDPELFLRWYSTPGTPHIQALESFNGNEFKIEFTQKNEKAKNFDFLEVPLAIKTFSKIGEPVLIDDFDVDGNHQIEIRQNEKMLILKDKKVSLKYKTDEDLVISLNRNFSAPIILDQNISIEKRNLLALHDDDPYVRWKSTQDVYTLVVKRYLESSRKDYDSSDLEMILNIQNAVFENTKFDDYFKSLCLNLPTEIEVNESLDQYRVDDVSKALLELKKLISEKFYTIYLDKIEKINQKTDGIWNITQMGARQFQHSMMNIVFTDERITDDWIMSFYQQAKNLTQQTMVINLCNKYNLGVQEKINQSFYDQWNQNQIVIDYWMMAKALHPTERVFDRLKAIESSAVFDLKLPNKCRAVFNSFTNHNLCQFHRLDGKGYDYIVSKIKEVDRLNPYISASLAKHFQMIDRLDQARKKLVTDKLKNLVENEELSKDAFEVISKLLHNM